MRIPSLDSHHVTGTWVTSASLTGTYAADITRPCERNGRICRDPAQAVPAVNPRLAYEKGESMSELLVDFNHFP